MPSTNLPTPDFTFDPDVAGACVAGVRPYRTGSYRLEAETSGDRFIVHNYGHGGAGITLSWGCAAKVRDIVKSHVTSTHDTQAAVLGSGVMGLTAATLLQQLGLTVTIYAERATAATTSHKAGGEWDPTVVEFTGKKAEFADILKTSYGMFTAAIGKGYGVSVHDAYTPQLSGGLDLARTLVPGLLPAPVHLARLPFEGPARSGYRYQTLLIEPPIFLPRLERNLKASGVTFVTKKFATRSEVLALPQKLIVNCTGLGAMTLWNDAKVLPIKGQLAMLPAQPALHYLYGQDGYMFPRTDHVVVGGTFEKDVNNETIDKDMCRSLVQHIASRFGKAVPAPLAETHIHHPVNVPMLTPTLPDAP